MSQTKQEFDYASRVICGMCKKYLPDCKCLTVPSGHQGDRQSPSTYPASERVLSDDGKRDGGSGGPLESSHDEAGRC